MLWCEPHVQSRIRYLQGDHKICAWYGVVVMSYIYGNISSHYILMCLGGEDWVKVD